MSAARSTDLDGAIAGYQWEFGDGNVSLGPAVLHVYDWIGEYTITLRVGDDAGAVATDTVVVTVNPAEAAIAGPAGEPRALVAGGGVVVTAPASVFRGGALVAQADHADTEALALTAPPEGFDLSLPALARHVALARDGVPLVTVRAELEVELTFDAADLILPDGSAVDPARLAAFVVRDDGTVGMLREVDRSDRSLTFATPRLGVMGLGVAEPGADLPDPETVAPSEDVNADGLVNIIDLVTVAQAFGRPGEPAAGADINGDGVVNIFDLVTVASRFGQTVAGAPSRSALRPTVTVVAVEAIGDGRAFDAAATFERPTKFSGIRFLHELSLAEQGWADDEASANQAHFTNSAPAIADIDGDGLAELVILGSVQNAAQSDRLRGVALWVLESDGSRPAGWTTPFHVPEYLAGLWDYDGTNVVGATNQVSVADMDPQRPGPEMVFAGFDGRIHSVDAQANALWDYVYTTDARVLTAGVLIVDLSKDGIPEVIFATYSPDDDKSHLIVLDAGGSELHRIALPKRGAMPVPTIADVNDDGSLEIVVSLKDGEDRERQVLVYSVESSADNCMLWATGRGNLRRNGFVP